MCWNDAFLVGGWRTGVDLGETLINPSNRSTSWRAILIRPWPLGEFYLDLEPVQVKLLDLEKLGANDWTVDPSQFEVVER
jgi:hypothetical protein